jgi:hypothetical protein
MFLVPKSGVTKWRLTVDLDELNIYCAGLNMSCETLKHIRHLSRPGYYFVSLDIVDGYYTLGIREEDHDFCTINCRGELRRLVFHPMGWFGSAYYFCKLTNYLRRLASPSLRPRKTATPHKP